MSYEYIFTHHLRDRFVQRTQKKYQHLWYKCWNENCQTCKSLTEECKKEVAKNRKEIDLEKATRKFESTRIKRPLNVAFLFGNSLKDLVLIVLEIF